MNNLSNWIKVPTAVWGAFDEQNKLDLIAINICNYCVADNEECGEHPYCCYKEAYKEYRRSKIKCNI